MPAMLNPEFSWVGFVWEDPFLHVLPKNRGGEKTVREII